MRLVVFGLPRHENQVKTKHVESSLIPRLDEGSSPSSSTQVSNIKIFIKTFDFPESKENQTFFVFRSARFQFSVPLDFIYEQVRLDS